MSIQERSPDIMEVITDLSNDEVRTPPKLANALLDLLPETVWKNSKFRWLDPGSKSGVFLREATKRLMVGLTEEIPDEQVRLRHILSRQMFGIGITELSAMMSRRALYCSKDASGQESVVNMGSPDGNLWHRRVSHLFKNGRCVECRAAQDKHGGLMGENHAYSFIHQNGREQIAEEWEMKFDVIVGNPPYQIEADEAGQNVNPLYDQFVKTAIDMNPRYLTMIIPSRWMAGGKGLDDFRGQMLKSKQIVKIVDFPNARELFPKVEIKGGVNFFLWARDYNGLCNFESVRAGVSSGLEERSLSEFDVFVRDTKALPILRKVIARHADRGWLSDLISTRDPFGPALSSNLRDFNLESEKKRNDYSCLMVASGKRKRVWVRPDQVTRNGHLIDQWKVFIPKAGSDGGQKIPDVVIGKPEVGEPQSVCTMSFIVAGPLPTEAEANSLHSYLRTKFARFLISLRKISQNTTASVYQWVPTQSWDRIWTDEELYEAYAITDEEREYIDTVIKEMAP